MRRILLSSVAVISCLAAMPAQAELEVVLGGQVAFQAGYIDNEVPNGTHRDFTSESELFVHAKGTTGNGLEYGAHISLLTSTSDFVNSKRTYVYLQGGWGRVEMGDNDGASQLGIYAPIVGVGQIDGAVQDYIIGNDRVESVGDYGDANFRALDSFRATKITYYTPVFSGFQAGVSFAPEWDEGSFGEAVQFADNASQGRNIVELAVRYDGTLGPVNLGVSGQYNFGEGTDNFGLFESNDLRAWGVGARLAYKGFTIGGGYTDDGNSLNSAAQVNDDVTSWNAGITYEQGPWGVGLSYLAYDLDENGSVSGLMPSDGTGGTFDLISLGGTYTVAPGLSVGADVGYHKRDRFAITNDTDGFVVVSEVKAAF